MEYINQILCGDCLKILPKIPECSVDLIITSPPYNIDMKYDVYVDKIPWDKYYSWCENWLYECLRVLKPDGRMALNHYLSFGNKVDGRTAPLMKLNNIALDLGFKHHTVAVWTDATLSRRTAWGSWLSASAPYIQSPFEGILILYKKHWKKLKRGVSDITRDEFMQLTGGIWNMKPQTKGITPANFCVDLPLKCMKLLSYTDSIVLDPFIGSGTTAEACLMTGRKYVGIELSPAYCDIARKRCDQIFVENEIL